MTGRQCETTEPQYRKQCTSTRPDQGKVAPRNQRKSSKKKNAFAKSALAGEYILNFFLYEEHFEELSIFYFNITFGQGKAYIKVRQNVMFLFITMAAIIQTGLT